MGGTRRSSLARTVSRTDGQAEANTSSRRWSVGVGNGRSTGNEKDAWASGSDSPSLPTYGEEKDYSSGVWSSFVDTFRRDPRSVPEAASLISGGHGRNYDMDEANKALVNSPLARRLKGRHLQMIAIGGSIGTGLFVGSGYALHQGGPASVLIAYSLTGIMLFCTVQALGELAVLFPVAGSFSAFSSRFLDPAWGFAMGWNYAMQWLVVLPLEIVSATLTISFWNHGRINNSAFVIIFLFVIIFINLFGVRGYGEAEFVFAIVKVIAVIGWIILGVILDIAGGQDGSYIGAKYWHDPGAFNNGFKGLCSVFVNAAFAFGGTELIGLAAAETANPRKSLPTAIKQVFWRITIFYVVSLFLVGLLVPYTDPSLIGASSADATASPFVIAIYRAQIAVLPSVMNVVIMIAVVSVGNSSIYGSSRTMAALADQGQAPRILGYIDRSGRPIVSVAIACSMGLLAFFAANLKVETVAFEWMQAISGLSSIFTWGSICLAHIRFRKGWRVQGHSLDELAFKSQAGLLGSWLGLGLNIMVLIAQFWTGLAPVGYASLSTAVNVESFFSAYLAAPVTILFYVSYKLYFRTPFVRSHDMDLHTGIRELNIAELMADERAERAQWPRWKRIYKSFC